MVIGPVLWTPLWGFLPEQLREKPQQEEEGATFINISSAAELAGRQPAMRHSSEDPHLCWTSWLLGFISLLLSICSTGAKSPGARGSEIQDSGAHVPLQGIRGGSVLFHVIKKQEAEPEEVSWGFGPKSNYRVLLQVHGGADTPTWVNLQDKYQQRVHVPNSLSLKIENLTCEDSGQYRARVSFPGGIELIQVFLLTVYEPVPFPQILMGSASITPDRCNVTLECRVSGATEDLNVTWENKGLPEEWEQRRTLEPASNSCTLAVSLPKDQSNISLVCVVSNPVGNKTASFDLGRVCVHDSAKQVNADLLPGILRAVAAVLLILGGGLYLWKTRRKKMETGRGARSQDDDDDDSIQYAELSQQESQQSSNKVIREQHLKERIPLTTIYSEVCKPGHAVKII
ncbi:SLAM family member 5-like isoform X2 [Dama dama]|uniref:SLAM family member 5-like isoform X2 n=1 Tax=Dama dama TaxID=30532 RepID=UPI002A36FB17|nr:SLAM family member 5-like isoform X2 [Dama dama]